MPNDVSVCAVPLLGASAVKDIAAASPQLVWDSESLKLLSVFEIIKYDCPFTKPPIASKPPVEYLTSSSSTKPWPLIVIVLFDVDTTSEECALIVFVTDDAPAVCV